MSRQEKLEKLKSQLREKEIYEIREKLEDFLQEDPDKFTEELQSAISEKLDGVPFPYCYFDEFLSNFEKSNQTDSAMHSDFRNRIYRDEED